MSNQKLNVGDKVIIGYGSNDYDWTVASFSKTDGLPIFINSKGETLMTTMAVIKKKSLSALHENLDDCKLLYETEFPGHKYDGHRRDKGVPFTVIGDGEGLNLVICDSSYMYSTHPSEEGQLPINRPFALVDLLRELGYEPDAK